MTHAGSLAAHVALVIALTQSVDATSGHNATAERQVAARSADALFGDLKIVTRRPDKVEWERILRQLGLTPWAGHDDMWRRVEPDGEVRAQAFFNGREVEVFLLFFPADSKRLSEATLSWLYRASSAYSFSNALSVELQFPEEAAAQGGTQQQSIVLSIPEGTIERTSVRLHWR